MQNIDQSIPLMIALANTSRSTFAKEVLMAKLRFLCSECVKEIVKSVYYFW